MGVLLGIDPGLAAVGWALIESDGENLESVLAVGVIRTKKWAPPKRPRAKKGQPKPPAPKVVKPSASEDNLRRAQEVSGQFRPIFQGSLPLMGGRKPDAVCVEAMSFPPSSSAAAKMALCWGVIAALSQEHGIPVIQVTPQHLKQGIAGSISADKEAVQLALEGLLGFPALKAAGAYEVPKSLREHLFDALGAAVACRKTALMEET